MTSRHVRTPIMAPLLLTVSVVIILFMRHGDSLKFWSRAAENPSNTHRALRLQRDVTEEKESLVESKERRAQENPKEISYAAFGTSNTWGAGVKDLDRETDVYPKLLSPNAANLSVRASGPGTPAMCLMSMSGGFGSDALYDVIIIEYHNRMLDEVDIVALYIFVDRLKKRFPDALVVFVRTWYIVGMIGYADPAYGSWVDIKQWNRIAGADTPPFHSDQFAKKFIRSVEDGFQWMWRNSLLRRDENLSQIASSVGAEIISLPRPENAVDFLSYLQYFAPDAHHLSIEGHKEIARRVAKIVDRVGIHQNPRLGSWDDAGYDFCLNWRRTGECPLKFQGAGVEIENWRPKNYALSFPFPTGGEIFFANPTNVPLDLYVDFMANGPLPSYYPLTEITVEYLNTEKGMMQLKPVYIDPGEYWEVHCTKPALIGTVPPGEYALHIRPVEPGKEYPFRVVGVNLAEPTIRFDTPEVHLVEPAECADVQQMQDTSAYLPRDQLTLSHYADPKTTSVKTHRSTDHAKVVAYVCNHVFTS